MSKLIRFSLLVLLTSCVEVRDGSEKPLPPHIQKLVVEKDFYLNETLSFATQREADAFQKFQKVHLGPSAHIITNGFRFQLRANELVSEGAKIETFSENSMASPGVEGIQGGVILIESPIAEGVVHVTMRGQRGGQGAPGKNAEGKPATCPGIPANSWEFERICKAQKGFSGAPGGRGARGGDSGTLFVNSPSSLDVQVEHLPGRGGPAGAGGKGGPGSDAYAKEFTRSLGGSRARRDYEAEFPDTATIKMSVPAGSHGEDGLGGEHGPQGESGHRGTTCLFNPDQSWRCDK